MSKLTGYLVVLLSSGTSIQFCFGLLLQRLKLLSKVLPRHNSLCMKASNRSDHACKKIFSKTGTCPVEGAHMELTPYLDVLCGMIILRNPEQAVTCTVQTVHITTHGCFVSDTTSQDVPYHCMRCKPVVES